MMSITDIAAPLVAAILPAPPVFPVDEAGMTGQEIISIAPGCEKSGTRITD